MHACSVHKKKLRLLAQPEYSTFLLGPSVMLFCTPKSRNLLRNNIQYNNNTERWGRTVVACIVCGRSFLHIFQQKKLSLRQACSVFIFVNTMQINKQKHTGGGGSSVPGSPASFSNSSPYQPDVGVSREVQSYSSSGDDNIDDDDDDKKTKRHARHTQRTRRQMNCTYPEEDQNYPSSSSDASPGDIGWANGDAWDDGDEDSDEIMLGHPASAEVKSGDDASGNVGVGVSIPEAKDSKHPRLATLHKAVCKDEGVVLMEGGASSLRFNTKAAGSPTYPFRNMGHLLLMRLVTKHQWSRIMVADLLSMLRFKQPETGRGFDISDLHGMEAEHFIARTRDCMPLYEVYKRDVRCSPTALAAKGNASSSIVYRRAS